MRLYPEDYQHGAIAVIITGVVIWLVTTIVIDIRLSRDDPFFDSGPHTRSIILRVLLSLAHAKRYSAMRASRNESRAVAWFFWGSLVAFFGGALFWATVEMNHSWFTPPRTPQEIARDKELQREINELLEQRRRDRGD